jgi:hypothetical protein
MPTIDPRQDILKFAYTYTLGLEELPTPSLKNAATIYVAEAFVANVLRLKRMILAPALIGDFASKLQRYMDIAEFDVTGTVTNHRFPPNERGDEIWRHTQQLFQEDTTNTLSVAEPDKVKRVVREAVETGGAASVVLSASGPE